jgi:two-component system response regulator YesN
MNRVLVVDDEQPVVDHIVRIIDRDLQGEFLVAGTASSGREALEKVVSVQPDIIVMDVKMPGLSGLDTIRELQKRGVASAFVLSTAYERFDIAREALELGVTGYLLKPVVAEALNRSLRAAAAQLDRRSEAELKEVDFREKDREVRGFVSDAFLGSLMLGQSSGEGVKALRNWLGIDKPFGLVAAAAFLHHPEEGRNSVEAILQYKSHALCGPLVSDRCVIFLPLSSPDEASEAGKALLEALRTSMADDLQRGGLRIGFADPRPLEDLARSWPEALGRLAGLKQGREAAGFVGGATFEEEEEFHAALSIGDSDRGRFAFEALLAPFEQAQEIDVADRYRIISLLGSAIARLVGVGRLDEASAHRWMDFDDLRRAPTGREFCLLARSRLPAIAEAAGREKRRSIWITGALTYIRQNYDRQLTLDLVADHVGVSPKRLSRLFIDELGQGFSDYLIDFRIDKARLLLAVPGASIKQVSVECGYPDPNYFARLFKKVTGQTPSEFSGSR